MKNKLLSGIVILTSVVGITGCDTALPDCDAVEVKKDLENQINMAFSDLESKVKILDMEKVIYDQGIGLKVCRGELQMSGLKNNKIVPFGYRIEYTDIEKTTYKVILYPIS